MLYKDKQAAGDLGLCIYDMIAKILDVRYCIKKNKNGIISEKE